ncbi:hypothetical protein ACE47D_004450, partial [Escherichia coli]|uniref:hypothetical protein n=1 Tax=Escherichia coli TaxID=562 RepID=UPI000D4806EF
GNAVDKHYSSCSRELYFSEFLNFYPYRFRINKKPGAKCLPGFFFIRQIAGLTANLLHRLQNTLI